MDINDLILDVIMQQEDPKQRRLKKDYDISKNVNKKICAKCGGECCKMCGCHFSPDDFEKINFEFLKGEIEKGYISIDYVDGEYIYRNQGCYILRMRNKGAPKVDIDREGNAPCIMLRKHGCKLNYKHRPTGGKLLIPSDQSVDGKTRNCISKYSIRDCCYEWEPYQNILKDLMNYFK